MTKKFDFYTPFYFPCFERIKLDKSCIYRKHKFKLSVWIYHREVLCVYFSNAKKLRKYLSSHGLNDLYDSGGCMIYLYLDEIEIFYPDFLKGVYSLAD